MSGETARESAGQAAGLRRDAIGLHEVLFQSITAMAPASAVAASISSGAAFAGGSLRLSVLIVLMRGHPGRIADTARVHLDDPSPTGLPQNGAVQR